MVTIPPLSATSSAALRSSKNLEGFPIKWSAGRKATGPSQPKCFAYTAPRPIQGAVFLPTGSASICTPLPLNRSLASSRCFSPNTRIISSSRARESNLLQVSTTIGPLPVISRNCFGLCLRLAGQKRVPEPPHMITANMVFLSGPVIRIYCNIFMGEIAGEHSFMILPLMEIDREGEFF